MAHLHVKTAEIVKQKAPLVDDTVCDSAIRTSFRFGNQKSNRDSTCACVGLRWLSPFGRQLGTNRL